MNEELWQLLAERRAFVFLHPSDGAGLVVAGPVVTGRNRAISKAWIPGRIDEEFDRWAALPVDHGHGRLPLPARPLTP